MTAFSNEFLQDLPPKDRRYDTPVAENLVFSVFPNGVKAWVHVYPYEGFVRRRTIGLFPDLDYPQAQAALSQSRRIVAVELQQGGQRKAPRSSGSKQIMLLTVGAILGGVMVALAARLLIGSSPPPVEPRAAVVQVDPTNKTPDPAAQRADANADPEGTAQTGSQMGADTGGAVPTAAEADARNIIATGPDTTIAGQTPGETPRDASGVATNPAVNETLSPTLPASTLTDSASATSAPAPAVAPGQAVLPSQTAPLSQTETARTGVAGTRTISDTAPELPQQTEPDSTRDAVAGVDPGSVARAGLEQDTGESAEVLAEAIQSPAANAAADMTEQAAPAQDEPSPLATADPSVISNPPAATTEPGVRAQLTTGLADLEPIDVLSERLMLAPGETRRVYFFTEAQGMRGARVTHRWQREGTIVTELPFVVADDQWKIYSSKDILAEQDGDWEVAIVSEDGSVLATESFQVIAPAP
ncbi:MAG: DUF2914 domain-containing protein [Gammaproteobacteria bacterium]